MEPITIKQVIVYRRDLKMRKGKIAAQVAHASMKVFLDRRKVATAYTCDGAMHGPGFPTQHKHPNLLVVPLTDDMVVWVNGLFGKIVLSVETEEDLLRVYDLAREAYIPCSIITDAGRTEFHGVPTRTTVAIGPAKAVDIDKITGPQGQVQTKLA